MIPIKPSNVIWSDKQWQAIYESGQNILVSAGAGSGKTAVLTERIKQKVLNGQTLQNLIVLTFTEDAANMMKKRIRENLIAALKEKDTEHLRNEIKHLDEAHIQTFDSFTSFLVKKYHYLLGIPQNFSIIDPTFLEVALRKIINEVFEELFSAKNLGLITLAREFTVRNAKSLEELFVYLNKKLELVLDTKEYLDKYFQTYFTKKFNDKIIKEYYQYTKDRILKVVKLWEFIPSDIDDLLWEHIDECKEILKPFIDLKARPITYDIISAYKAVEFPKTPKYGSQLERDIINRIKKETKALASKIDEETEEYTNESDIVDDFQATKEDVQSIIAIYQKIEEKLMSYKTKHHLYTFMDVAKMAIKVLKDYPEICEGLKNKTEEILIDEYQDTSNIQEAMISLLAKDNVYMVGDIKQSIYRFRNANPDIFKEKYQKYKKKKGGIVIDLMKNYRSREEVIYDINLIFEDIMDVDFGGVNYNKGHRLKFGNLKYNDLKTTQDYHLDILLYSLDPKIYNIRNLEKDAGFTKEEIEAFTIGNDILSKIGTYQVCEKGALRPITYKDIAILASSTGCFQTYGKVFKYLGIPFVVSSNSSFIHSEEVLFLKALLECSYAYLDNNYYDKHFNFSLLSFLRSFVIEASDDTIHKLFYENQSLKEVYPNFDESFYKYAQMLEKLPLCEVVEKMIDDFDLYQQLIKLGSVKERSQKIDFFYQKSADLHHLKTKEFLDFLQKQYEGRDTDIEFNFKKEANINAVSMTSIHKSKGLEYALCYVSNMDKQFNRQDLNQSFLFNEKYGIIVKNTLLGLKPTILHKLFRNDYIKEDVSEKIRLLYVALTRAKEKLIFVMPAFKMKDIIEPLNLKLSFRSLFDILNFVCDKLLRYSKPHKLYFSKDYLNPDKKTFKEYPEVKKEFIKPIVTKDIEKYHRPSKSTSDILTSQAIQNMKKGEEFHQLLEVTKICCPSGNNHHPLIDKFLNHPFFQEHQFINEYHEYQYFDENNHLGIIDLILETNDSYYIIDYKLRNIDDDAYYEQLKKYQEYLSSITTKSIKTYLYSITKNQFKELVIGK